MSQNQVKYLAAGFELCGKLQSKLKQFNYYLDFGH